MTDTARLTIRIKKNRDGTGALSCQRADAPPWGSGNAVGANLIDRDVAPSLAGATRLTSVQYSARVPSHGVSPSVPRAMQTPVSSQIWISVPLRSHPAEHVAPT